MALGACLNAGQQTLTDNRPQAKRQQGADLALTFASVNRLVFSIMSQPSLRQPSELRGKSLGITRYGSSTHTAALVALDGWGLVADRDVSLLQLQEVPAILAAMQAGQIPGEQNQIRTRHIRAVQKHHGSVAVAGDDISFSSASSAKS